MNNENERKRGGIAGPLIGFVAIVLAVIGGNIIVKNKKPPERRVEVVQAPLVNAQLAEAYQGATSVAGNGVVESHNRLMLNPEVGGVVTAVHPQLVAGGVIEQGDTILTIDRRDYEARLDEARAALERARFELTVEEGWQDVARREWKMLGGSAPEGSTNRDLALRVPHLKERKASLKAAEARVALASLSLERTTIKAPFKAQVLTESVALGQVINPAQAVAELVGIDEFRVVVSLPLNQLDRIVIPASPDEAGSSAQILQRQADGGVSARSGRVVALAATLDRQARMARVYVSVENPMARDAAALPLLLESYVRVEIETRGEKNLVQIPREALHDLHQVWVIREDDTVEPREVDIVHRDDRHVWVASGVEAGEKLLTSALRSIVPGMPVRIRRDEPLEGGPSDRNDGA